MLRHNTTLDINLPVFAVHSFRFLVITAPTAVRIQTSAPPCTARPACLARTSRGYSAQRGRARLIRHTPLVESLRSHCRPTRIRGQLRCVGNVERMERKGCCRMRMLARSVKNVYERQEENFEDLYSYFIWYLLKKRIYSFRNPITFYMLFELSPLFFTVTLLNRAAAGFWRGLRKPRKVHKG